MKKFLICALALCMAMSVMIGCSNQGGDNSLTYIKDRGKLIVGLDDSFPPMGFRDDAGNLVGFDIDLAKEVGKRMGVEIVLQPIDWNSKEMELSTKTIDVIWNAYTITDERKEKVLFSEPYMENTQVVVVLKDSEIEKLADLAGKKVAVQDGSSAQEALKADKALYDSIGQQVNFDDNVTAFLDVDSKQVDALAIDAVVANYYLTIKPETYRILDETLAPEEYGIGFRKEDKALRDEVQKILNEMIKDGTAKTISEEWFSKDVTAK